MNIENKKQFATIAAAVALGFLASFLASHYVSSSIEEQTRHLAEDYKTKNDVLVKELTVMKNGLTKVVKNQQTLEKRMRDMPKQMQRQILNQLQSKS